MTTVLAIMPLDARNQDRSHLIGKLICGGATTGITTSLAVAQKDNEVKLTPLGKLSSHV